MALLVYWYDFICFGIVGISVSVALFVLLSRREGKAQEHDDDDDDDDSIHILYEDLLIGHSGKERGNNKEYVGVGELVSLGSRKHHATSSQLWTTCWRGLHPVWLLVLRFVSFLTLSSFLAWDIHVYDISIFVYYTEWTFLLVIVYFAIGTVVSVYGCMVYYLKKLPQNDEERDENPSNIKLQSHDDRRVIGTIAGFSGYLMQTAYQTCAGAVLLTDIVFWCLIVPFLSLGHFRLNMLTGCMHTLNAAFLLLDTFINSLPFPWFRVSYFVLWSCCYVIFQWVIHACGFSWWPYPFLELETSWAPLWYLCLGAVHIPCYGLYYLVVRVKNSMFPVFFPLSFVKSSY